MKRRLLSGLCVLAVTGSVSAIEPGPSSSSQKQTEAWLELQVSGKAASSLPQPASPIERDLSMQRWLDSYQHPIPDFYEQKKGGSVSGGSSGGN
ncbi:DUF3613 domain-containing protein [Pseudomonas sp. NPDC087358]|jgi:hypothetical protein|uniref:DUF3613 domain-containing protein n=1 Tax=Pseudomonas sp. NPDC087358 TaxID=3364439 RepID=UPI00384F9385